MPDHAPRRAKKVKKAKIPPLYIPVSYPFWLGVVSLTWAVVGWVIAAAAPHLAFVPAVGALHYAFPAVTVALIGTNLFVAVRDLLRGAHVLRLMVVTGLQVALFTTLFFQLYAHVGASLYDAPGPTSFWQWTLFSLAHAVRAADVIDGVEAFGATIQPIKHQSAVVAVFVIAYHVVVDVFFLNLLWSAVAKIRRDLLEDEGILGYTKLALGGLFAAWLLGWMLWALVIRPWALVDIPLWFVENVLRVLDFADVMESFNLRLHKVPREGVNGLLTTLCRVWVGIAIMAVFTRKRKAARRVLTPPHADPFPYWMRRVAALGGMAFVMVVVGGLCQVVVGNPAKSLAAAVAGAGGRAADALRALRRMGPSAGEAVPALAEARRAAAPDVRDEITRTLGHLGPKALEPLAEAATGDGATVVVESLGRVGVTAAPALAKVWATAPDETVKKAAAAQLKAFGDDAMPALMAATNEENADTHYHWFGELDRNWQVRTTTNATAKALQSLPDYLDQIQRKVTTDDEKTELSKVYAQIEPCGSASVRALPAALGHLNSGNGFLSEAATKVIKSAGPAATLRLLDGIKDRHPSEGEDRNLGFLADAKMWNVAAFDHPGTLPLLTRLAADADPRSADLSRRIVFAVIDAGGGPQFRQFLPTIAGLLGDESDDLRARARQALAKLDPNWKQHPDLSAAYPAVLPRLPYLPKPEADELFTLLGDLRPTHAGALARALAAGYPIPPKPTGEDKATYEERIAPQRKIAEGHDDRIVATLKRFGPRVEPLVPAMTAYLDDKEQRQRDSTPRDRLITYLAAIGPPDVAAAAMVRSNYHQKDVTDRVVALGPGAIPGLAAVAGHPAVSNYARKAALDSLAAFGPAAKGAVHQVLTLLGNTADVRLEGKDKVLRLCDLALQTLPTIDPNWADSPATHAALAALAAGAGERDKLAMLLAAGPAAKPHIPMALAAMVGGDQPLVSYQSEDVARQLDKFDRNWRDRPDVAAAVAPAVERYLKEPKQFGSLVTLLRAASVPTMTKAVETSDDMDVCKRAAYDLGWVGVAAKPAAPAVVKLLGRAAGDRDTVRSFIESLDKMDPDWLKLPEVKAVVPAVLSGAAASGREEYVRLATLFGADAVPTLVKHAAAADNKQQRALGVEALGKLGPVAAAEGLPVLVRQLNDADDGTRRAAYDAVNRLSAGHKELVPDLVPLFAHPDVNHYLNSLPGVLDAADPEWRKHPKVKATAGKLVGQLTDTSVTVRRLAMVALGKLGVVEGVVPALERAAKQDSANAAWATAAAEEARNRAAQAAQPKPKKK